MQNYRIHRKQGTLRHTKRPKGIGTIIIVAVVIVVAFLGVRLLLSNSGSDGNTNESDEIQTLESLLNSVNVPLDTGQDQSSIATNGTQAKACSTPFSSLDTDQQIVALTFDSGGIVTHADQILATLQQEQIPAMFFLTGTFAESNPGVVKAIADAGFSFGNHSNDHQDFTDLTQDAIADQITTAEEKIETAAGKEETHFVRPPYGSQNAEIASTIAGNGYCTALWSIDAEDWKQTSTAETIVAQVKNNLSAGDIIMMQFGHETIAEALPQVIAAVKDAGYSFVDLSAQYAPPEPTAAP